MSGIGDSVLDSNLLQMTEDASLLGTVPRKQAGLRRRGSFRKRACLIHDDSQKQKQAAKLRSRQRTVSNAALYLEDFRSTNLEDEDRSFRKGLDRVLCVSQEKQRYRHTCEWYEGFYRLPICELSLEKQKSEINRIHEPFQRFLAPPLSKKELTEQELKLECRFPELLRWYCLNISRDFFRDDVNTVEGYDYDYDYKVCEFYNLWASIRHEVYQHILERFASEHPGSILLSTDCHGSCCYTALCLIGRAAGYAYRVHDHEESRPFLINLFDFLKDRRINETSLSALHSFEKSVRCIQKQFRLWQWRKRVVFNPHTEIGRLNLLIKFRTAIAGY